MTAENRYTATIGENFEIPLHDNLCDALGIEIGDILICEKLDGKEGLSLSKYHDQSLSNAELEKAGNLTRVIQLPT